MPGVNSSSAPAVSVTRAAEHRPAQQPEGARGGVERERLSGVVQHRPEVNRAAGASERPGPEELREREVGEQVQQSASHLHRPIVLPAGRGEPPRPRLYPPQVVVERIHTADAQCLPRGLRNDFPLVDEVAHVDAQPLGAGAYPQVRPEGHRPSEELGDGRVADAVAHYLLQPPHAVAVNRLRRRTAKAQRRALQRQRAVRTPRAQRQPVLHIQRVAGRRLVGVQYHPVERPHVARRKLQLRPGGLGHRAAEHRPAQQPEGARGGVERERLSGVVQHRPEVNRAAGASERPGPEELRRA